MVLLICFPQYFYNNTNLFHAFFTTSSLSFIKLRFGTTNRLQQSDSHGQAVGGWLYTFGIASKRNSPTMTVVSSRRVLKCLASFTLRRGRFQSLLPRLGLMINYLYIIHIIIFDPIVASKQN